VRCAGVGFGACVTVVAKELDVVSFLRLFERELHSEYV
jgi:hypothetical protein